MNALLTYAVGSAAVLAVLWGGFRLLLRSQKTFRVNRVLLNVILYFSLCAPLLLSRLSIPVPDGRDPGVVGLMTLAGLTVYSDGEASLAVAETAGARVASWLPEVLAAVYVAGVALTLLIQVAVPVVAAVALLLRGRRRRILAGGRAVTVVSVPSRRGRRVEPMSWFGIIFLPAEEDFDTESYVMQHELAHVRMRHSLLLLNASLLLCLQWFNPAAWLLIRDLRQNCEFEADDAVLSSGADRRGYQLSLVGRAARGMAVSLASPFRNSTLYRRIAMIQKAAPDGWRVCLRLLYVVPVALAAAVLFARPLTAARMQPAEVLASEPAGTPVPYPKVEGKPLFMGGSAEEFTHWVYSSLEYPQEARENGAGARVTVQFRIRSTGEVSDVQLVRLDVRGERVEDFDYNVFADAVLDVVGRSPRWTPGQADGRPVDVTYNFPVYFQTKN